MQNTQLGIFLSFGIWNNLALNIGGHSFKNWIAELEGVADEIHSPLFLWFGAASVLGGLCGLVWVGLRWSGKAEGGEGEEGGADRRGLGGGNRDAVGEGTAHVGTYGVVRTWEGSGGEEGNCVEGEERSKVWRRMVWEGIGEKEG